MKLPSVLFCTVHADRRQAVNCALSHSGEKNLVTRQVPLSPRGAIVATVAALFPLRILITGVPNERVSILLGHESVRTTERNYAPRVGSRQEQLEADLARAWGLDPVIAAQISYTRKSIALTHSEGPVSGKQKPRGRSHRNREPGCHHFD